MNGDKSKKITNQQVGSLISPDDPSPINWTNRSSTAAALLICEHAGFETPKALNHLGLSQRELQSHIGWDIGAQKVAEAIAYRLNLPLIVQQYSRLLIDCNRPPGSAQSILEHSDGIAIPANHNLTQQAIESREREIFTPFDGAIKEGLTRYQRKWVFSIHSFTPEMSGIQRPWNAGFLSRSDPVTGEQLINHIRAAQPNLILAHNQPYSIDDESDWLIPKYAEPCGLKHSLIEIRNDQLTDDTGIALWAELLAGAIAHTVGLKL